MDLILVSLQSRLCTADMRVKQQQNVKQWRNWRLIALSSTWLLRWRRHVVLSAAVRETTLMSDELQQQQQQLLVGTRLGAAAAAAAAAEWTSGVSRTVAAAATSVLPPAAASNVNETSFKQLASTPPASAADVADGRYQRRLASAVELLSPHNAFIIPPVFVQRRQRQLCSVRKP